MAKQSRRIRRQRAYIKRIVMPFEPVGLWNTRDQSRDDGGVPSPARRAPHSGHKHWPQGQSKRRKVS